MAQLEKYKGCNKLSRKNKVTIIGFDGLDPVILKKWLPYLPNFSQMIKSGCFAETDTIYPPITPGGWTSMVTGKNPGKTGILGFAKRKEGDYGFNPIFSTSVTGDLIWNILRKKDFTCGLINIPTPTPPDNIECFYISGRFSNPYAYPNTLQIELEKRGYTSNVFYLKDFDSFEAFKLAVYKDIDKRVEVTIDLLTRFNPDFSMVVFNEPDTLHHYIDDERDEFELYKKMDWALGQLKPCRGVTIIVSDHGFSKEPVKGKFHTAEWLKLNGYLKILEDTSVTQKLRRFGFTIENVANIITKLRMNKLLKFVPRNLRDKVPNEGEPIINWENTKVFLEPISPVFYFNIKGRERKGCVSANEELENLKASIKQKLSNLKNGNEDLKINVWTKEELYWGEKLDELPDMIFNVPDYLVSNSFKNSENGIFSPPSGVWKRIHDFKGVLILSGENILQGRTIKAKLYDIAPTILYLMGCPVSEDLDGGVLKDVIVRDYFKSNPPQYYHKEETKATSEQALSQKEEQEIISRLRGLGYIE